MSCAQGAWQSALGGVNQELPVCKLRGVCLGTGVIQDVLHQVVPFSEVQDVPLTEAQEQNVEQEAFSCISSHLL